MKQKILFIEAKQNFTIKLPKQEIKKLPKRLFLAYSVQYKQLTQSIKKQLQSNKIKVERFQQVLGCTKIRTLIPILLISTGRFHAQNLYLQAPAIYILENNKISKIPDSEINKFKIKKSSALMKFLNADKIGILVSTKPGQENLKQALNLKEKLIKKKKETYIFISNTININEFENFNIDFWVNTACDGLFMDSSKIINIQDIVHNV